MTTATLQRSIASNGIAYHQTGAGSPLVLVHGVGLRAESFGPQIAYLEKSFSVYAIDLPGHGDSQKLDRENPSLGDFTTVLEEFVDEVISKPILLAGHSMGAMIALDFVWRNSGQSTGIAALNAIHCRSPEQSQAIKQRAIALTNEERGDVASAPVRRWFGEKPMGLELLAAQNCNSWLSQVDRQGYGAAYEVFAHSSGLTDTAISQINLPMLFLTGADDENSTPEMSRTMTALAPKGEAVIVRGAGHLAQLTHAKQINSALGKFFAQCVGAMSDKTAVGEGVA